MHFFYSFCDSQNLDHTLYFNASFPTFLPWNKNFLKPRGNESSVKIIGHHAFYVAL